MNKLRDVRYEYAKKMEQLNKLLQRISSDEINSLVENGLVTINRDTLPKEEDIIRNIFNNLCINYKDSLLVYVCDLIRYQNNNHKNYAQIRDIEQHPSLEEPFNTRKYIGLLTGK